MTDYPLTWLGDVLGATGLKLAEVNGWRTRGLDRPFTPKGVMCHHTGGPAKGNMPSLGIVTNGRPDLTGPLSQLALGRDGTFYLVAAGFAQHAGAGNYGGLVTGNTCFIGIEAENTGLSSDPWPDVQVTALRHGVAAILARLGAGAQMCCGHKEWARPVGRKTDPTLDMNALRAAVGTIMAGAAAPLPLIPAHDGPERPTLRRGCSGEAVSRLQTAVRVTPDGQFGGGTEAAVRAAQAERALVPDGIVGPRTWAALDVA